MTDEELDDEDVDLIIDLLNRFRREEGEEIEEDEQEAEQCDDT